LLQSDTLAKYALSHLTVAGQIPQNPVMRALPSHFQNCHQLLAFALLERGGTAFAWHDVSLKFDIKGYFILERMDSTMTSLGMTIRFVSTHIIFSVAHPKYL
jgi:hypothetical protein